MVKKFSPDALSWARAVAGLTQAELGIKAGVSGHQISRIETGTMKPRKITLIKLCKVLNAQIDSLYIEVEDEN